MLKAMIGFKSGYGFYHYRNMDSAVCPRETSENYSILKV